jgi:hypothetical protein
MLQLDRRAAQLYLLRAGVFLLIGPFVAGIGHQTWLMRIGYFYDTPIDLILDTIIVIFGAYVIGWKAAIATGLVMGGLFDFVRWQPASLVASVVVGGAAGLWLVDHALWVTRAVPDWHQTALWHDLALGALGALVPTWVLHHDRYLRPRVSTE